MTNHTTPAPADSVRAGHGASSVSAVPAGQRRSSRSARVRRGAASLIAAPVAALMLSSCFANPFAPAAGGSGGGGGEDSGAVGFDGVQSATIQIEAVGTFVSPEGAFEAAGRGSGFIIDESGLAVTNNHVVVGAGTLKVWRGGDQSETLNAKILGSSECLDLAVIDLSGDGYPTLGWYEGDVKVATDVYTAGFPLGDPTFNMTKGIVSKADTAMDTQWASIDHVIEHDARIRGGNSGGPLVDTKGRVLGVNYAGNDQHDQNLAIATEEVREVVEQLAAGENVLSLGINGTAITDGEGNGLGIWVNSVASGGIADEAGVEPGDLLTRMEGVSLGTDGTMADYCDVLRTRGQDATLAVDVYRPSEDIYYRGQMNGDPLEAVSVPQAGGGTSSGGGSSTGTFSTVVDDSGSLQVDVDDSWQLDTSAFQAFDGASYARVEASPDLAAYASTWDVPGMSLVASSAPGASPDEWFAAYQDLADSSGCVLDSEDVFDDGYHDATYRYYTGCGGAADLLVLSGYAKDGSYLVTLTFTMLTEADVDAMNRAVGSFFAQF
ncbi:S1C family serine protease [Naasia sp. SYSU D00948]|uniref:S1C family serine protease n=1 Tax=Naasia sp. SYSU D00948 TaxID=2817379 RepID=UPI001B3058EC|nr:trypsin-like peptidase domain-containing protein [Naasia sp. SYSU D00948]